MCNNVINKDPEIMGGTPVFTGTRVPVRILMEYLETGGNLDGFLHQHPSVSREQAVQLLALATEMLTAETGSEQHKARWQNED